MAFSGMGSGGGRAGRGRWRSQQGALSEMNVVPLVDVVLVLLIIFMVTASVMEFGLNIDVPQVKQVKDTTEEHPVVSVAQMHHETERQTGEHQQHRKRGPAPVSRSKRRVCARGTRV